MVGCLWVVFVVLVRILIRFAGRRWRRRVVRSIPLDRNDFHAVALAIDVEWHHQLGKLRCMHLELDKNCLRFLVK
jgi:hypothetical protein